ncbi:MAG: hypothetical protein WC728_02830 [Elusimicrobiota bacterium]
MTGLLACLIALGSALPARAYLASPPDQAPREVTTLDELEKFYKGKPGLAKEWAEIQQQLKAGDKEQQAPEQEPSADAEPVREVQPMSQDAAPAASAAAESKTTQVADGLDSSAMAQLKKAAGEKAQTAPPAVGPSQEADNTPKVPCSQQTFDKGERNEILKEICTIAEAKSQGGKMQALYQEYLAKVYFAEGSVGGPLVKSQMEYIRKGIKDKRWEDFPTAAFGGVPPGAAATWEGSGDRGGGHITMAPGLLNMRIFDHEWLHHSDAGHADNTPIGVNEMNDVEPPCYKYMGCAPGMSGC